MILQVNINETICELDPSKGFNITIPIQFSSADIQAFYIGKATKKYFQAGSFIGSVNQGGACNVETLSITPHGNGTHTECVGHISKESFYLPDVMKEKFHVADLISVNPEKINDDLVITKEILEKFNITEKAIIIRTLPNEDSKKHSNYSGTNPVYFNKEALEFLREKKIEHLITDLPSVDKEDDGGILAAHHAYWNYPENPRMQATITELVYIENSVLDGKYLVQFSFSPIYSDAVPSELILFKISHSK